MMTTTSIIHVYIANLGRYNEGHLVGMWLDLPATSEEIEALFVEIGLGYYRDGLYHHGLEIDEVVYEEYAIHDFETEISGQEIDEYDDLCGLNDLALALSELDDHELDVLQAACEYFGYHPIDIIDRMDEFILYPGIHNESDLGYYWVEENGAYGISQMGPLARYIDFEAFGRDIALEAAGGFTSRGFVEEVG